MSDKLMLIDGNSIINRAFYGVPVLTNSKGQYTNAVYGFFNRFALYRFTLNEEQCTHCGACHQVCGLDIDPSKTPNHSQCIRCGKCLDACPHGAICSTWQKKKDKELS